MRRLLRWLGVAGECSRRCDFIVSPRSIVCPRHQRYYTLLTHSRRERRPHTCRPWYDDSLPGVVCQECGE